ncbi:MAG: hypothetical protein HC904_08950 [Blastochloris sp.]|nr:hypothetical protein [Blastochloris sp.]
MGGALFLFPDVALIIPLAHVVGDSYLAYLILTGVFICLFLVSTLRLGTTLFENKAYLGLGWVLSFFFIISHPFLWPSVADFWHVLYHPIVHGGAYLLILAGLLIVPSYLQKKNFWLLLVLGFLVLAGTISDLLFLVYFTLPSLVALTLLAWREPTQRPQSGHLLTCIMLSSLLARLLRPFLDPGKNAEADYISKTGLLTAWDTIFRMISDLIDRQHLPFIGFSLLSLLATFFWGLHVLRIIRSQNNWHGPTFYLKMSLILSVACGWGALLFSGNYVDPASWRYLVFPSALSLIFALWLLSCSLPRFWGYLGLVLCLGLCLSQGLKPPRLERPYLELVQKLDAITSDPSWIVLGDYWTARKSTFQSRQGLRVEAICSDGSVYHWANSWKPYLRIGADPNQTVLVVMDRLDTEEIRTNYGAPHEEWTFGTHLIYRYNPPHTETLFRRIRDSLAPLVTAEAKKQP